LEHLRQLVKLVLLSLILLAVGTAGYILIEGWGPVDALYMTVITLATVGFSEVHGLGASGRIFTIVLSLLGVSFTLYMVGSVVQFLVEGRIQLVLGRRKLDKRIRQLKGHYIVCGYGRIGRVLCRFLLQKNLKVAVIEIDPEKIAAMEEDGVPFIAGEAGSEENLNRAGIDRARGLLTALGTDADNVFLVLSARRLNPGLLIVARADQDQTKKTLLAAGANMVISPYDIGARRMAHAILRPTVIQFLEMAFADEHSALGIEEFPVTPESKLVGVALKDSLIRQELNLLVISIKRPGGKMTFNPSADTCIESGDTLVVVGENRNLAKLERRLNV
jgi:voltage-gated potassium channel